MGLGKSVSIKVNAGKCIERRNETITDAKHSMCENFFCSELLADTERQLLVLGWLCIVYGSEEELQSWRC